MDPVNIPAKFEVRSFKRSCDSRGYSKKFGKSLDTPTLPFLQNVSWACVRIDPVNVSAKFAVRSFSRSWDNNDCSLRVGLWTPILGKGRPHPLCLFSEVASRLLSSSVPSNDFHRNIFVVSVQWQLSFRTLISFVLLTHLHCTYTYGRCQWEGADKRESRATEQLQCLELRGRTRLILHFNARRPHSATGQGQWAELDMSHL